MTCEHGGNAVPADYAPLFEAVADVLATHRGYDIGALDVARALAKLLPAPLIASETTRLLVDLNRSPGHRALLSEFTRDLSTIEREALLDQHYRPYRARVETAVADAVAAGGIALHVSSHSFTPELDGERRHADVGLLYDPSRPLEAALCAAWRERLRVRAPALAVRRNYPYRGTADGLVTHLRRRFSASDYAGVELEVNQRLVREPGFASLRSTLAATLQEAARAAAGKLP